MRADFDHLSLRVREQSANKQRTRLVRPFIYLGGVDGRTEGIRRKFLLSSLASNVRLASTPPFGTVKEHDVIHS
jgi:hypothetical protein